MSLRARFAIQNNTIASLRAEVRQMNKKMNVFKSPPSTPASTSPLKRATGIGIDSFATSPSKRSRAEGDAEDETAVAGDDGDGNVTDVSVALAFGAAADASNLSSATKGREGFNFWLLQWRRVCWQVELQVFKS